MKQYNRKIFFFKDEKPPSIKFPSKLLYHNDFQFEKPRYYSSQKENPRKKNNYENLPTIFPKKQINFQEFATNNIIRNNNNNISNFDQDLSYHKKKKLNDFKGNDILSFNIVEKPKKKRAEFGQAIGNNVIFDIFDKESKGNNENSSFYKNKKNENYENHNKFENKNQIFYDFYSKNHGINSKNNENIDLNEYRNRKNMENDNIFSGNYSEKKEYLPVINGKKDRNYYEKNNKSDNFSGFNLNHNEDAKTHKKNNTFHYNHIENFNNFDRNFFEKKLKNFENNQTNIFEPEKYQRKNNFLQKRKESVQIENFEKIVNQTNHANFNQYENNQIRLQHLDYYKNRHKTHKIIDNFHGNELDDFDDYKKALKRRAVASENYVICDFFKYFKGKKREIT